MNKRGWKQLALVTLVVLAAVLLVFGTAGAEGKKLIPRIKVPADYTPKRGGPTVSGQGSGVTCEPYTYTVNAADTGAVKYEFLMAIDDDPRPNTVSDVMYASGLLEDNEFEYTFYQPGIYYLFVFLYDSDNQQIPVDGFDYLVQYIEIREGTGTNPLTVEIQKAAAACNKQDDFLTAVAINDYLVDHVTYDFSFTYYSPEGALLKGTSVCNGYSRAYQLIAKACGLDCLRVIGYSEGEAHAWNVVKINGLWYQVDPTWNDGMGPFYQHVYMGLNDTLMSYDHSDFDFPDGLGSVTCSSLEDNYFVHTGKWRDLAGDVETALQAALNETSGYYVTVTADYGEYFRTEIQDNGEQYVYVDSDSSWLKRNGHIVAWALGEKEWTRSNQGTEMAMEGTFTYSYSAGSSIMTGEMKPAKAMYDMTGAAWNYTEPFIYDGTEKRVEVTGLPEGVTVKAYSGNAGTDAGVYTAGVILDYDEELYLEPVMPDCAWEIVPRPVTGDSGVTAEVSGTLTYDGTPKAPALTVKDGEKTLVCGLDYQVTYKGAESAAGQESLAAPSDAGNYTAVIAFRGNYTGTKEAAFSILPRQAVLVWTDTVLEYNGTEQRPSAAVSEDSLVDGDTCTVTVTGGETDAGTGYTAVAAELSNPNYCLPDDPAVSFEITPNDDMTKDSLTEEQKPAANEALTYSGEDQELVAPPAALPEGYTGVLYRLNAEDAWSGTVPTGKNAGSYAVQVLYAGDRNHADFEGEPIEVAIGKAIPAYTVPAGLTAVWGQSLSDVELPDGWAWKNPSAGFSSVGDNLSAAVFTPEDTGNYAAVELDLTVTVARAPIAPSVSLAGWSYGDPANTPEVSGNPGGGDVTCFYRPQDGDDSAYVPEVPRNAGTYLVKAVISATDTCEGGTATAVFVISRAAVTVQADDLEKVLGDPDPEYTATVTGLKNGDAGSVITYTLEREAGDTAGTYAIIPRGAEEQGNYGVSYLPGTLSVRIRITVPDSMEHGSAAADRNTAAAGETVTLTVHPAPGYETDRVTYTPDGGTATEIHPENGVYAFAAPDRNTAVHAEFRPVAYTVVFDANGGSGNMDPQEFIYDAAQKLRPNGFFREDYIFSQWNTAKDGSGTAFEDEEEAANLTAEAGGTVTLYAQWLIKCVRDGHTMTPHGKVDPTCTETGTEAYWECSVCGGLFADEEGRTGIDVPVVIAALGHDEVTVAATATCTEGGKTEGRYCRRCGEILAEQTDVPALGHSWGTAAYAWSADNKTCTATHTCTRDKNHVETESGKVTSQTTPATTEAEGKTVYTATFTKTGFTTQTKTVTIPKLEPPKPAVNDNYSDPAGTGTYSINADGTATFKKPAQVKATVTIPATVKASNGVEAPVTAIADKAFQKDKKLTTVTIGANIKTIGKSAFADCKVLKTVKGGAKVEEIRANAFSGCEKLSKVPAFKNLKTIGAAAFKGCKALTKITIGANVSAIGKNAFNGCAKLKTITIKSTLLTKKNVKSGAFKGINAKAAVKCPKKKLADYKKFLNSKGVPKTAKIK